jgi:hypothetical protein
VLSSSAAAPLSSSEREREKRREEKRREEREGEEYVRVQQIGSAERRQS